MKKNRQRFGWLVLLLVAGLLFPSTVSFADSSPPGDDGIVIWNEDYALEEGESLAGNLVVFNGDTTLQSDSHVEGSVIIWNGNVEVEGTVDADVVVSGGDIYLGENAWVGGSVVCSWKCDLEQEDGAHVEGGFTEGIPLSGLPFDGESGISIPSPSLPTLLVSGPGQALNWMLKFIRGVSAILVVAAVAGLVALIWPDPTDRIGRTVVELPWHSIGIGVLTVAAVTVLIITLTITICLSPVAALAGLALGAAGLFGWIGIGAVVGERLLQALSARDVPLLWAAGLGTLLITLVGVGLSSAFCLAPLGWLVMIILGCLGLGAVVLTRFGTMPYTPAAGPGQERGGPTSSESTSSEPEEALEPTDHTEGPASIELPEEPLEEPPEEPSEEPSEEAKETDVENSQE